MRITHLYHSGVFVELEHHQLLFDYIKGYLPLDIHKPLYIFVSHHHSDHFDPCIFNIQHPHITYIFSSSIEHYDQVNYVDVHQTYHFDDIEVKTLLSTDIGCAFIVHVEGKTIYHAGDLHWWHWQGEPQEDNDFQKINYQKEIDSIGEVIDVAFVVVDQRQEDDYLLGIKYFLKHVQSHYIFPIHYFGDYSITQQFEKEKLDNPYQAQIIQIHHHQESFEI